MTLYRQLFLGTSLLFLLVLGGIEGVYLVNGRTSLERQIAATAQDAATSIALSLGSRGSIDDAALVEVTLSPIFDRGYYSRIAVTSASGEVRAARTLTLDRPDTPAWFVRLFPISSPTAEAMISAGWKQLGRVSVTSHPHFIYEQLWNTAEETFLWLMLVYAVSLVALRVFLTTILRPLSAIDAAARAIAGRQFPLITSKAGSVELQKVIESVNLLSGKIRTIIEDESAQAERLRRNARTDALTGIYTRQAFEQAFENIGVAEGDVYSVLIGIWQIDDLKAINDKYGRERADEMLVVFSEVVEQACRASACLFGRLSGSEFVIAGINLSNDRASELMTKISTEGSRRMASLFLDDAVHFYGGAHFKGAGPFVFSDMLGAADLALAQARLNTMHGFEMISESQEPGVPHGSQEWRRLIESALGAGRFVLYGQKVFALSKAATLHTEIFSRLLDTAGGEIEARVFIPMMARHRLLPAFDAAVVHKVIEHVRSAGGAEDYAVNVSSQTLDDNRFTREIMAALRGAPDVAGRLTFEMTEFGVAGNVDGAVEFARSLRAHRAHFAIDHFSMERTVLARLPALLPRYVKLSADLTTGASDDGGGFLLASLKRLAQPLEIQLIAQFTETAEPSSRLEGIAGYQGFGADLPKKLD